MLTGSCTEGAGEVCGCRSDKWGSWNYAERRPGRASLAFVKVRVSDPLHTSINRAECYLRDCGKERAYWDMLACALDARWEQPQALEMWAGAAEGVGYLPRGSDMGRG